MKKIFIILITFINLSYAQNIEFFNPSFDCKDVKKESIEYLICTNKDLSKQDKELNEIYIKLLQVISEKEEFIKEQREFIKERNTFDNIYEIKDIYESRLVILENIYKFININSNDYKEKKLDYININGDTSKNGFKSKLLVNLILKKIDIFDKRNYQLLKNGILYKYYGSYLEDGLYYASTKTGTIRKLIGGNIAKIIFLKNSDTPKIAFKTESLKNGLGSVGLHIINLQDDNYNFNKDFKTLIEYSFYGESYYCGLENLDWLDPKIIKEHKKSGQIEDYEYDEINNLLKVKVIEQDCSSYEYKEKKFLYDLKKDSIIDKVENKVIYDSEKDIFINVKDKNK